MSLVKSVVPADLGGISLTLDFIEETLKKYKFKPSYIRESMLLSEESMVRLIDNASEGDTVHISIKKSHGLAYITLSAPGTELSVAATSLGINVGDMSRGDESAIRGILLRAFEDKIRYARKGRYNFVKITVGSPEVVFAARTMIALGTALITGLLLQLLCPEAAKTALDSYVLVPIEQIFVNILMLFTAPAIFFSVITSVAHYSSFSDPGRVSVKTFVCYVFTSILAVLIGSAVFNLFNPGTAGELAGIISQSPQGDAAVNSGFIDTLVSIVPSNIIEPFLEVNTIQLLFMALVCGIALGRIGDYSSTLRNMAEALNALFTKVVSLLMNFIPVATFASTVSMMLNVGNGVLLSVVEMVGVLAVGVAAMFLIYSLLVLIVAHVNPIVFIRKYAAAMKGSLFGSELSALNKTMRCCKKSFGISPKVYTFSIPFGSSFNMDGNCVYLTVAGLFIARLCGLELFDSDIVSLVFTVFILSIGSPITPGSAILCLTVLLSQLGISITAVSILFGVNTVIEMFLKASNSYGDVAVSLAIAQTEDLVDTSVYS